MKNQTLNLLALFLLVSIWSCKRDDGMSVITENNDPSNYEIIIQNEFVTPPSKVSVFYRVVDGLGDPVSNLTEGNFSILERGRNDTEFKLISKDEADRIISDNNDIFRNNVVLLLDLSGSVVNNDLDALKLSSELFVNNLLSTKNTSTKIGIFWFDGVDVLHELIGFTDDLVRLTSAIASIEPNLPTDRSTDLFGAILKGTAKAQNVIADNIASGFQSAASIITFTDGTDQAARHLKSDAFKAVEAASSSIDFYTIGLGSEIDDEVLEALGPKSALSTDNPAELADQFQQIADAIFAEANSFYLFEYCTPKRDGSGENGLRIEVSNSDGEGAVNTTFNATGFESGVCQLF